MDSRSVTALTPPPAATESVNRPSGGSPTRAPQAWTRPHPALQRDAELTAHTHRVREHVLALIERLIVEIDRRISRQVDEILHHPRFQQLEASWRGLAYLVETEAEYDENLSVKLKVLNVSWKELAKDVTRALEFDQSSLFQKLYSEEFGTPGGEPFGVVLGDYQVSHRPRPGVPASDIEVLREISRIATAALCPFITNACSTLLGYDGFDEMSQTNTVEEHFRQHEFTAWRALRNDEHTRFLGLTLPRVLMREPYRYDGTRHEGFAYREDVSADLEQYLWGSACYAFGSVLVRAFANTGWFADIRGGVHEFGEGGVVRNLVYSRFNDDRARVTPRAATDVQIDDFTERELSDQGFIPLCSYHSSEHAVFYSNSSAHEPPRYDSEIANINAKLSAMIQYMLCVSRFGHYIKLIGRDKLGSFTNAKDCERLLQNWLNQYTTSSETASAELKARYPLASSRVEVTEQPGRPGHFTCVAHLQPHFQLDQLVSSIRLVTELAVGATSTGS